MPESLMPDVVLAPHQQRALERLDRSGSVLAYHQLGSGKTLESIAASLNEPTDVVTPASLRENYRKEVEKFVKNPSPDRQVRSYEDFTGKGPSVGANTLVLDEAHRLGNEDSARTQAILEAAPQYARKMLLSGTPIRNAPHELAPIIKVLNPDADIPLDEKAFNARFLKEKTTRPGFLGRLFGKRTQTTITPQRLDEIRKAIRGHVDYRGDDTKGFPSRKDVTENVEMSPEQADVYRTVTEKANPIIAAKVRANMPLNKTESSQLNAFLTAARITSNTAGPYGGEKLSPKLQGVLDGITRRKRQSYVYSNYLEGGVSPLYEALKARGIEAGLFTGQASDEERKQLVEGYNTGKIRALLAGPSGSEGLDLKGTRDVYIMEPHFNEARTNQAIGRAIRQGSHEGLSKGQRNVTVHRMNSTLPAPGFLGRLFGKTQETSADQYLTDMAATKQRTIEPFLQVLREEGERPLTAA